MKKFTLLLAFAIALLIPTKQVDAQLDAGASIIDLTYGYSIAGNVGKTFAAEFTDVTGNYFGPIGLRYEYLASEKFGIGAEINYRTSNYSYSYTSVNDGLDYIASMESYQLRVMGRLNFHYFNDGRISMYSGFGIGYTNRHREFTSPENGYAYEFGGLFQSTSPIAARIYSGGRFMIVDNLGINVEVGIGGGSFFNGGLSYVF